MIINCPFCLQPTIQVKYPNSLDFYCDKDFCKYNKTLSKFWVSQNNKTQFFEEYEFIINLNNCDIRITVENEFDDNQDSYLIYEAFHYQQNKLLFRLINIPPIPLDIKNPIQFVTNLYNKFSKLSSFQ